jgi:hypothetical protein
MIHSALQSPPVNHPLFLNEAGERVAPASSPLRASQQLSIRDRMGHAEAQVKMRIYRPAVYRKRPPVTPKVNRPGLTNGGSCLSVQRSDLLLSRLWTGGRALKHSRTMERCERLRRSCI